MLKSISKLRLKKKSSSNSSTPSLASVVTNSKTSLSVISEQRGQLKGQATKRRSCDLDKSEDDDENPGGQVKKAKFESGRDQVLQKVTQAKINFFAKKYWVFLGINKMS